MKNRIWVVVLAILWFCLLGRNPITATPLTDDWVEPAFLDADPGVYRIRPYLAADTSGNLHALWHVGRLDQLGNPIIEVVEYAFWDGSGWSEPVDVVAAPNGSDRALSQISSFTVTPDGTLLAVRSQEQNIIISQAPADSAMRARSWSSTWAEWGEGPALTVFPDDGQWCLAYWLDASTTLTLSCSDDRGRTWVTPNLIWLAAEGTAGSEVGLLAANDRRVHLVWTENVLWRNWSGEAIWHAVFDSRTGTTELREVARSIGDESPTMDNPTIAECSNGQIHLFWNNGVGSASGRFHQWFNPESKSWSDVEEVFPGLSGLTSRAGLTCDSTGRIHLITAAQGGYGPRDTPLRYATWFDGEWAPYETLWNGRNPGERPTLAIANGNKLHLLWDAFRGPDQISGRFVAHSYHHIDAVAISPAESGAKAILTPDIHILPTTDSRDSHPIPTASSEPYKSDGRDTRPASSALPIVVGVVAVLPLLAIAFLVKAIRQKH